MLILVVAVACSGERHGSMVDIGGQWFEPRRAGVGRPHLPPGVSAHVS
ncbi:MAG TPA: hypothetical protein VFM85_01845 [Actinomycetota bacterium]|nr:hypothetical protein [Actinomycetota bacterium]